MANSNSTLVNVYSRSFPGKNLFEVSLVRDTDPQLAFYKPKFFCFVSMTPGATNNGARTFTREGKVTIKADCEKVMALANSLRCYARNQDSLASGFSIFADSSRNTQSQGTGMIKQCFAGSYISKNKEGKESKWISISVRAGQNQPFGNSFSQSEAMAVADIIETIGKLGIDEDIKSRMVSVGVPQEAPVGRSEPQLVKNNNDNRNDVQRQSEDVQKSFIDGIKSASENSAPTSGFEDDVPFAFE